jgi:2-oxoglutarate ferredoxin oxidoreductase subunit gamma
VQVEVILSGIGGQGVKLAAKTLAMAATAEGRQVMMSAHYGGEMRGGQTEAQVVVARTATLRAAPILESAWSAFVMHPRYWAEVTARLRPGGPVVYNSSLPGELAGGRWRIFEVPAGEIAAEAGNPLAAGFVLLGAYAAITSLVEVESLVEAMKQLVPPYRAQHVALNEAALRAGAEAARDWSSAAPAWDAAA